MSIILPSQSGPVSYTDGLHTFWGAYDEYKALCAQVDREWGENTQNQYEAIVRNRLVPNLPNHDRTPIQDYTLDDFQSTIESIRKKGQYDDPENFKEYDEETLKKYWHILKTVVKVAAGEEYFRNVFDESVPASLAKCPDRLRRMKELWITPKSFSVKQEYKVARYLLKNLNKRGENIALFLMYALGLRNEEACGANFGHIIEMTEYPGQFYLSVVQTTQIHSNQLKLEGKTYNTYRNIPIPPLALKVLFGLLEERKKAVDRRANDNMSVLNLGIAYRGNNMFARCGADSVTRQAQKMFEALGMRETVASIAEYLSQDFSAAKEDMVDYDDFALIEKEPTAYLLRRNFATHMAILQLTQAQLEYIIGHIIEDPQTKRSDFQDERELYEIKRKMDMRPILNDVKMLSSSIVRKNQTLQLSQYAHECILEPDAVTRISISAKEPGDSIKVTVFLKNGAHVKEEFLLYGKDNPHHFASDTNILKAYHDVFREKENE